MTGLGREDGERRGQFPSHLQGGRRLLRSQTLRLSLGQHQPRSGSLAWPSSSEVGYYWSLCSATQALSRSLSMPTCRPLLLLFSQPQDAVGSARIPAAAWAGVFMRPTPAHPVGVVCTSRTPVSPPVQLVASWRKAYVPPKERTGRSAAAVTQPRRLRGTALGDSAPENRPRYARGGGGHDPPGPAPPPLPPERT